MTNVSAAESGDHQATHQRQGATDCHEYWQARSATCWPTCTLAHTYRLWRTGGRAVGNMSGEPKKAWRDIYLVAPRRRTRSVSPCRYGPVLQILQNGFGQGPFFSSDQSFAARFSSDSPRLKAFCRVAPSVLLNVRAMFAACVLLLASFFKLRTSFTVQVRLRLFILWSPRSSQNAVSAAVKKN